MTQALRERIDAGEHFAADVTHELKNPIASVRSAVEGLGRVKTDEQRAQLLRIADEDRSEEHTSELQSLMRISYAVFCLKKKKENNRSKDKVRKSITCRQHT